MISKNNFLIISACLLFANTVSTTPETESLTKAASLMNEVAAVDPIINAQLKGRKAESFSDVELLALVKTISSSGILCSQLSSQDAAKIVLAENILVGLLKKFKVTGFSFCIDPNGAFIWDNQNPQFDVVYKNNEGKFRQRTYQASIDSVGFKFAFALKFNLVFIVNTDFNFYDTNKTIELNSGIEFSLPIFTKISQKIGFNQRERTLNQQQIDAYRYFNLSVPTGGKLELARFYLDPEIMYVPFKNMPGALLIVGYALGIGSFIGSSPLNYNLSYVQGGTLTPAK